jgi:hypothetical protein
MRPEKYITRKQILEFIKTHKREDLKNEILAYLEELKIYPKENRNQIRFYSKVLTELSNQWKP